jgi:hypothetical protein
MYLPNNSRTDSNYVTFNVLKRVPFNGPNSWCDGGSFKRNTWCKNLHECLSKTMSLLLTRFPADYTKKVYRLTRKNGTQSSVTFILDTEFLMSVNKKLE